MPAQAPVASDGSIFQVASFRGLFEDRRARLVGDIMTIQIQEKTSAKQSSNSSVDRAGTSEAKVSALPFLKPATAAKVGERLGMGAETNNTFEGKGATGSDNEFTGTITVTVIEVLANGNLMVAGEKQVGINQNVETLRFSGVVNPASVLPGSSALVMSHWMYPGSLRPMFSKVHPAYLPKPRQMLPWSSKRSLPAGSGLRMRHCRCMLRPSASCTA